jgi:hypothetical protein
MAGAITDAMNVTYSSLIIVIIVIVYGSSLEPSGQIFILAFLAPAFVDLIVIVYWWSWSSQAIGSFLRL